MQWFWYALASALFAAAVSVLAKLGLKGVDSNLATAIRTVVVLIMSWVVVWVTGAGKGLSSLTRSNLFFLVLSGLATGASWLFYFRAIQLGEVSKVVPIDKLSIVFTLIFAFLLLKEPFTGKTAVGALLITAGTLVLAL